MKRLQRIFALTALVALAATLVVGHLWPMPAPPAAVAQTPGGALNSAVAGAAVTKGRFVYLTAANTVQHATAVTHPIVGVCNLTQASANGMTRYVAPGGLTTVTSGETIAVGNLLTGGTLGKAFVLDADDASTQYYGAIALTACTGADNDVTVFVCPGVVEQRLDLTDITAETVTVDDATTPTITLATGKANTGTITVNGKTSGKLVITTADATAQTVTLDVAAQTTSGASAQIPDLGGSSSAFAMATTAQTLTNKTVDGDDNTLQDVGVASPKVLTSNAAIPFVIVWTPTAAGTTSYTVPTGKKLRVLNAVGYKAAGNGAHADDDLNIQNNDGAAANIFSTEELNAVNDGARFEFDGLDDSEYEVAAGDTLDLVANENGANGCDCVVTITCVWVTP